MSNDSASSSISTSNTVEGLLNAVLTSTDLPTLPTVAAELVSLTAGEDVSLSDIADLVSRDVALCSKLLKLANSAFYGFPQQIGSIHQAVSILGTNAVQSLVLSFSLLSMKKTGSAGQFDYEAFWQRSLYSAVAAKLISEWAPGADKEEVFVSALLQNLGQLILATTLGEQYDEVIHATADTGEDWCAAEVRILGADHSLIGSEVARYWHFPLSISQSILHHHEPMGYTGTDEQIRHTVRAIYLSDLLINIFYSSEPQEYHRKFQAEAARLLNLDSKAIDTILESAHTELHQGAAHFGMTIEEARPVREILQEANIRLSLLNLNYEQVNQELIKAKMSLEKLTAELEEKNFQLKELANHDGLTGIFNRRYFQTALEKEMNRSARMQRPLSLVMTDIDHFKRFNDEHGHLAGDFVLIEFCKEVGAYLREYDTLARYGGEEFVVILPETPEKAAYEVAEKLRAVVENHAFREAGKKYRVTASFGVATLSATDDRGAATTDLIKAADDALYQAKKKGRNRVVAYAGKKKWFAGS